MDETERRALAELLHGLNCARCRLDWTCGGVSDDDLETATKVAQMPQYGDLLDRDPHRTKNPYAQGPDHD